MTLIRKYRSRVVSHDNPLPDIHVLTLESLDRPFDYVAGQFLHLALDDYDPSGPWPQSRCFSIQSSAEDKVIKLTYAVKGAFTKGMSEGLKPGSVVWLKLPYGDLFAQDFSTARCLFVAGGTGVTPFLSLFTSLAFGAYLNPKLYLGVRTPLYNIYEQDLSRARVINPGFEVQVVAQDTQGILSIEQIYQDGGDESVYFLSGPPLMIRNFKSYLLAHAVASANIRTDDWE